MDRINTQPRIYSRTFGTPTIRKTMPELVWGDTEWIKTLIAKMLLTK